MRCRKKNVDKEQDGLTFLKSNYGSVHPTSSRLQCRLTHQGAMDCDTLNPPMPRVGFLLAQSALFWDLFRLPSSLTLLTCFRFIGKNQTPVIPKKGWALPQGRMDKHTSLTSQSGCNRRGRVCLRTSTTQSPLVWGTEPFRWTRESDRDPFITPVFARYNGLQCYTVSVIFLNLTFHCLKKLLML